MIISSLLFFNNELEWTRSGQRPWELDGRGCPALSQRDATLHAAGGIHTLSASLLRTNVLKTLGTTFTEPPFLNRGWWERELSSECVMRTNRTPRADCSF